MKNGLSDTKVSTTEVPPRISVVDPIFGTPVSKEKLGSSEISLGEAVKQSESKKEKEKASAGATDFSTYLRKGFPNSMTYVYFVSSKTGVFSRAHLRLGVSRFILMLITMYLNKLLTKQRHKGL